MPDPLTPVTTTSLLRGNSRLTFLRLWTLAPRMMMEVSRAGLFGSGTTVAASDAGVRGSAGGMAGFRLDNLLSVSNVEFQVFSWGLKLQVQSLKLEVSCPRLRLTSSVSRLSTCSVRSRFCLLNSGFYIPLLSIHSTYSSMSAKSIRKFAFEHPLSYSVVPPGFACLCASWFIHWAKHPIVSQCAKNNEKAGSRPSAFQW